MKFNFNELDIIILEVGIIYFVLIYAHEKRTKK